MYATDVIKALQQAIKDNGGTDLPVVLWDNESRSHYDTTYINFLSNRITSNAWTTGKKTPVIEFSSMVKSGADARAKDFAPKVLATAHTGVTPVSSSTSTTTRK